MTTFPLAPRVTRPPVVVRVDGWYGQIPNTRKKIRVVLPSLGWCARLGNDRVRRAAGPVRVVERAIVRGTNRVHRARSPAPSRRRPLEEPVTPVFRYAGRNGQAVRPRRTTSESEETTNSRNAPDRGSTGAPTHTGGRSRPDERCEHVCKILARPHSLYMPTFVKNAVDHPRPAHSTCGQVRCPAVNAGEITLCGMTLLPDRSVGSALRSVRPPHALPIAPDRGFRIPGSTGHRPNSRVSQHRCQRVKTAESS